MKDFLKNKIFFCIFFYALFFVPTKAATCQVGNTVNNTYTYGPITLNCGSSRCVSATMDYYLSNTSTAAYYTQGYYNCEFAGNLVLSGFSGPIVDLSKCNSNYTVLDTSIGINIKVYLTCNAAQKMVAVNSLLFISMIALGFLNKS